MQINPVSSQDFDRPSTGSNSGDLSFEQAVAFRSMIKQASETNIQFTQVASNHYRAESLEAPEPVDSEDSEPAAPEADRSETRSGPTQPPPVLMFTPLPMHQSVAHREIKTKVNESITSVVAQIRLIQSAYKTVEFELPESQLKVKFSTIGDTSKIQIQTQDPDIESGLSENKNVLTALIKQAIESDYVDIQIDGQGHSNHSDNPDNSDQHQDDHQDTPHDPSNEAEA